VPDQPRCLCIVSSDLLRSGEFITALGDSLRLRPQEPVEIILDRRHGGSSMESGPENRRSQPLVDRALATNGFAIVPVSVYPDEDRTEAPIEPLIRENGDDLRRLQSILDFRRRRSGSLLVKLRDALLEGFQTVQDIVDPRRTLPILAKLLAVVICVALAAFAMSPAWQNLGKSLIGRMSPGSPPTSGDHGQPPAPTDKTSPVVQLPQVTDPASESPLDGGPARTKQAPLRKENGTPPTAARGPDGSGGPTPSVTARPSPSSRPESTSVANKPASKAAPPKRMTPRMAGSPRVELAREPRSVGWGDSYTVRLLNPAGEPMVVSEIVLIARMADGTVENIAMGALPEPGIYRATVPTRRSAPINLRVRLSYGEKRLEIPVRRQLNSRRSING
jgi:hypothetical protein